MKKNQLVTSIYYEEEIPNFKISFIMKQPFDSVQLVSYNKICRSSNQNTCLDDLIKDKKYLQENLKIDKKFLENLNFFTENYILKQQYQQKYKIDLTKIQNFKGDQPKRKLEKLRDFYQWERCKDCKCTIF
ncbi:hypothetical protein PPERSA_06765 [Pseudocohnilembus persalinus]|uniref:Uncharacterized protein n=1 Tax=Pseudocohnilembus persalinus TaxID=266149 RepID=A0A0V0QS93_PSEPJ|nr:hypothetical protein PPERSA_06765 [Pseudocohnilembus persalinus]|eukprot:KRX05131.1 hypothetical protein PPERSA_06765 [Pseudocohnilembus persalinus]